MVLPNLVMWIAATVAAGWKLSQLIRAPHDRDLRIVTTCVLLVFLALTAQLAATTPVAAISGWFPSQSPKLIQNVVLTFFFALLIVLLRSTLPSATGTVRGYLEPCLAVLAAGGLITAFAATSPAVRGTSYEQVGRDPGLLVFYLVGNLYMAYATARGASLAYANARHTQSRARIGLRVAAAGLALCCLGTHIPRVLSTASRLTLVVDVPPGTQTWTTPLLAIGIATFFVGIGYPGLRTAIVKARLWFEARHRYAQLRPLWMAVCTPFPDIALFPAVGKFRDASRLGNLRLRYYRRVIECRDGLVCLSPYLTPPATPMNSPTQLATLVRDALRRAEQGAPPTAVATVVAAPTSPGMDADIHELLALSQALKQLR